MAELMAYSVHVRLDREPPRAAVEEALALFSNAVAGADNRSVWWDDRGHTWHLSVYSTGEDLNSLDADVLHLLLAHGLRVFSLSARQDFA